MPIPFHFLIEQNCWSQDRTIAPSRLSGALSMSVVKGARSFCFSKALLCHIYCIWLACSVPLPLRNSRAGSLLLCGFRVWKQWHGDVHRAVCLGLWGTLTTWLRGHETFIRYSPTGELPHQVPVFMLLGGEPDLLELRIEMWWFPVFEYMWNNGSCAQRDPSEVNSESH